MSWLSNKVRRVGTTVRNNPYARAVVTAAAAVASGGSTLAITAAAGYGAGAAKGGAFSKQAFTGAAIGAAGAYAYSTYGALATGKGALAVNSLTTKRQTVSAPDTGNGDVWEPYVNGLRNPAPNPNPIDFTASTTPTADFLDGNFNSNIYDGTSGNMGVNNPTNQNHKSATTTINWMYPLGIGVALIFAAMFFRGRG